jgi:hypothetical protein
MSKTGRNLAITHGPKLGTGRRISKWIKTLFGTERIVKAELQICQREETSNSNWTKRAEAGDYERKKGKANGSIKICMFPDFNLFLLHKARILELVLMATLCRGPSSSRIHQRHHFDIHNKV